MKLKDLQTQITAFLAGEDNRSKSAAFAFLDRKGPVAPEVGLSVYRENYFGTFHKTLQGVYPVTEKILNPRCFEEVCREFIYRWPSRENNLNSYGEPFAAFMAEHPISEKQPYLADLARLEWYWEHSFFAADDKPLEIATLGQYLQHDPAAIYLQKRTSLNILTTEFPLIEIWREAKPLTMSGWRGIVVWRDGETQKMEYYEPELHPVINAINRGYSLEALARLPAIATHPERLQECLLVLLRRGFLNEVSICRNR